MKQDIFPVVIIAGGLATRLRPLTTTIPKSLVLINDEPFIFHQLRLLQKQGVRRVYLCIGFLGEQIVEAVGDGSQFGMEVSYSFDGDPLLGTAGAIRKIFSELSDNFFVLNGDSYLMCDYASVQNTFLNSKKLGLMTVFRNDGQWDTSNVEYQDHAIIAYDKKNLTPRMLHIDYGLEVFSKKAFEWVPDNTVFDLATLLQDLLKQNQLAVHEVFERFYENGSFSGIQELADFLVEHDL